MKEVFSKVYKIFKVGTNRMVSDFSVLPNDRTRDSGHKLKHSEFPLSKNATLLVAEH